MSWLVETAGAAVLIWLIGFIVITVLVQFGLRSEPTAHGQSVGTQIGCIAALLWPIVLPWILIVLVWQGIAFAFRWVRAKANGS